jgi:hypothetical protein
VRNSRRARFNINKDKMVTEVPHYEAEAEARDHSRAEVRAEIARLRTEPAQQFAEKARLEKSPAQLTAAPAPAATTQPSTLPAALPRNSPPQSAGALPTDQRETINET